MPYLRLRKNGFTHCVKLYASKDYLEGNRQSALCVFQGGRIWYAQSLASDEAAAIQKIETKLGICRVCSFWGKDGKLRYLYTAAGNRSYRTLATYYDNADAYIDASNFPIGGCILVYSGAGYTAGGSGGAGQVKRIDIPAGMQGSLFVSARFPSRAYSGGSGGGISRTGYSGCDYYAGNRYYAASYTCKTATYSSNGHGGGAGGMNAQVYFSCQARSGTVYAWGGGGGGGAGGTVGYYSSCAGGRSCALDGFTHGYGGTGAGGKAGNGADANGAKGGSAFSSETDFDSSGATQHKVVIGAYTE